MKNWTPRKWASRRKNKQRPRFLMRRDQAQAKENIRAHAQMSNPTHIKQPIKAG